MKDDDAVLELFRRAATDRSCGAAEIEVTLIRGLLDLETELRSESLLQGARILVKGQPAMANLRSLAAAAANPDDFSGWLERRRLAMSELPKRLAANGWPFVRGAQTVLTVSKSTAVAAVVEGAWKRGWDGSVVVFDGSESGRGPEQAARLTRCGGARSQPDAAVPEWLEGERRVVVVGADAVGPQSFINSTGTRLLLEAARDRAVERVLVADTGKDVSQRVFDELVDGIPTHNDPQGRSWPVFEVIPLELVSARVSEDSPVP